MDAADHISPEQFLKNAALLLGSVKDDAGALQRHLAEFIDVLPQNSVQHLDVILLQSVDQLTQILDDLATAFLAISHSVNEVEDQEGKQHKLASILGKLKLERVRDMLTYGNDKPDSRAGGELF